MRYVSSLVVVSCLFAQGAMGAEPTAFALDGHGFKVHPALTARFDSGACLTKAWVFFTDKGVAQSGLGAALDEVEAGYDAKARARRALRRTDPGLFDERDLPVAGAYRDAVAATGARPHVESRWVNALSVVGTREQIEQAAALPFVRAVEPVRSGPRTVGTGEEVQPGGYGGRGFYGLAEAQLSQINLIALHGAGLTGQGVVVGVLDTGFRRDHVAFTNPAKPLVVIAERDFINSDNNTAFQEGDPGDQHHHGTLILGTLAAYKPDELVGGAFDASYILCKTEDVASETPVEEDNYVAALEFIELHGGDVATSSLSYSDWYTAPDYNGVTAVTSIAVNTATANGLHVCTAAGNAGNDGDPGTAHIGAPADALRVVTCGAVDGAGTITWFSSDGPTADGRVKPELLALGSATKTVGYDDTTSYVGASGTSLSTPLVAGAVACLAGAHPEWTADQMRAALLASASDFVLNGVSDPLFVRGFGILNALDAWGGPGCGSADFDGDGDSGTDLDIENFFACLGGNCCQGCGSADFDGDGDTGTDMDIEAFFRVLGGGAC